MILRSSRHICIWTGKTSLKSPEVKLDNSPEESASQMKSMTCVILTTLVVFLALSGTVDGFSVSNGASRVTSRSKGVNLYMGRAAAVRAATKSRTDGAKAKNNSR